MTSAILRQEDGTITLTITIPWENVQKVREEVMGDVVKGAKVQGFRPGKAPAKLVEESVNEEKVREEVLKKLLPETYMETIQKEKLRPIVNPKIHVEKLDEGKDWVYSAEICELPEVKLGDYKTKVKSITAKSKIAIPGKEPQEPNFDDIMNAIVDAVELKVPKILIDMEVDRLLTQMFDEMKRLGISLDQYLQSTNKTPETLREEYAEKAARDIRIEFALQKIADEEKLLVDPKEIEEAINKAKDPAEKANLEQNRYMLANILRQQKTLDFIKSL